MKVLKVVDQTEDRNKFAVTDKPTKNWQSFEHNYFDSIDIVTKDNKRHKIVAGDKLTDEILKSFVAQQKEIYELKITLSEIKSKIADLKL